MGKQYILNGTALVASVVGIVWSRLFTGNALEWVIFGLSAGIGLLGVAGLKISHIRRAEAGFGLLALVGAWSAVAALVFTGATLGWLAFAGAVASAVVAAAALVLHEMSTERVVHTLEVQDSTHTEYRQVA